MKTKKGKAITMNVVVFTAILLVILVILLSIFTKGINLFDRKEFNPEIHNCMDADYWDEYRKGNQVECRVWQPKNKCELNPTTQECICDEYVNYGEYVILPCEPCIHYKQVKGGIGFELKYNDTLKNEKCLYKNNCIFNKTKCIKAHEPSNEQKTEKEDYCPDITFGGYCY